MPHCVAGVAYNQVHIPAMHKPGVSSWHAETCPRRHTTPEQLMQSMFPTEGPETGCYKYGKYDTDVSNHVDDTIQV